MYQVLYRKYRPKSFSDVYGQPHITTTLINELKTGKIAHAYLFTGTRGTGKTTCAKILAKAVNCLNPRDGDACGECEMCRGIDNGSVLDVIEIDAASNNGVDYIRDLRETASFTPASAKYRVYIIDEVHMLSDSAFNALLKTLEEPPEYMIFILATTEVHKVPATILSRCQRFDFHRIPMRDITARVKEVAKKENIALEDDAAELIARCADGALRDALSLLDRCASIPGTVTSERAVSAMGSSSRGHLFEISDAAARHDSSAVLEIIDRLYNDSKDMTRLCAELIAHYRDLMLAKTLKKPGNLINGTADELTAVLNTAHRLDISEIIRSTGLLQQALQSIRAGSDARTELEMTLIKMTDPSLDDSAAALNERVSALEGQLRLVMNGQIPEARSTRPIAASPEAVSEGAARPLSSVSDAEPADESALTLAAERAADRYRFSPEQSPEPQDDTDGEKAEKDGLSPINDTLGSASDTVRDASSSVPASGASAKAAEAGCSDSGDSEVDCWPEILKALAKKAPLLAAALKNSRAVIRGDLLLIDSENPMFRDILRADAGARNSLKSAAAGLLGKVYRLGPYTPPSVSSGAKSASSDKGTAPEDESSAASHSADLQNEGESSAASHSADLQNEVKAEKNASADISQDAPPDTSSQPGAQQGEANIASDENADPLESFLDGAKADGLEIDIK